jgi:hypothetical protein
MDTTSPEVFVQEFIEFGLFEDRRGIDLGFPIMYVGIWDEVDGMIPFTSVRQFIEGGWFKDRSEFVKRFGYNLLEQFLLFGFFLLDGNVGGDVGIGTYVLSSYILFEFVINSTATFG